MSTRQKPQATPRNTESEWKAFVKAVGATLAAERKALGMTQQQVAERLQVEPETVSRIESGTIVPTLQRLRQFAEVYGCTMESLISQSSDQASDIAKRLAQEMAELCPLDRTFVAEQTKALVAHLRLASSRRG
jgi:transcriptional regulator with XRE-family HTH domain